MKIPNHSSITYDNIRFLDEPIYPDGDGMDLARWHPTINLITIYTKVWKQSCTDDDKYYKLFIDVIHHESLHGIIDVIIESDDVEFPSIFDHWPHLNGMDEPYVNDWE